jgi:UDP-N-acetylmuramoyl-L-alanyl-D-glutamate--2,6-diaminopimelate ligase
MWQKIKNYYHLGQAVVANCIYGFPSRKLTVIGVTGTDGKTTTSSIIYHILTSAGKKAAMITSVGAYIGDGVYDIGFHVTTPSPFGLQKYIRKAVDSGTEYLVLETTSHALDQYRVWGIPYKIGVLTNVTHEHLDYHKTYLRYMSAKFKLLRIAGTCVINLDDESYALISGKLVAEKKRVMTYSRSDPKADLTPQKFPYKSRLLGDFNVSNTLAAIGAVTALNLPTDSIKKAIATFTPPPGRQEIVYDRDFRVMIDFAHTPNAFAEILPEVKKITPGRLIHVFGSAGKRDAGKRPEMGMASATYSDIIILTAEDPRDEKVAEINRQIMGGIKQFSIFNFQFSNNFQVPISKIDIHRKYVFEISDRREAIDFAIAIARKGDTVIVTGKSHEKSMNLGHGEEPWDEFEVVKNAFAASKQ